jgi:hypothetical protein
MKLPNGKRSAFVVNLEILKRSMHFHYAPETNMPHQEINLTQIALTPEYRIYLRNKYMRESMNHGLFFQAGLELVHFSSWKGDLGEGSGFELAPASLDGYFVRNVPVGLGYKIPLKAGQGIELNMNTNFMEVLTQGNNQTFSFGIKYFWMKKQPDRKQ